MSVTKTTYNDKVVRQFAVMTVIWGIVGMLVGVIIAAQLVWPELNIGFLHFGRLRPLHTNAVIFAFGGCALFAGSYFIVQRTCHVRLFSTRCRPNLRTTIRKNSCAEDSASCRRPPRGAALSSPSGRAQGFRP